MLETGVRRRKPLALHPEEYNLFPGHGFKAFDESLLVDVHHCMNNSYAIFAKDSDLSASHIENHAFNFAKGDSFRAKKEAPLANIDFGKLNRPRRCEES